MTKINFISSGDKVAGNLFRAATPKNLAFLLIQGWTGRQNILAAQALADLGFTSMTYDMRGHGDSEGQLDELSRADFISDAAAAYDFLKSQLGKSTKIGVIGSSFGGYTAVMLTKQRPVEHVSLRVPACYPDEGMQTPQSLQLGEWRKDIHDYAVSQPIEALRNFAGHVQVIEAGADEIVPHRIVQNYVDAVKDKRRLDYKVMENAPHRLADEQLSKEYVKLLTTWAQKL